MTRQGLVRAAALAACLLCADLPPAAHAATKSARQAVGAIAYHRASGSTGWAVDQPSARRSKVEALRQCGDPRCEVVASLRNNCGAIANGPKRFTAGKGATRQEAQTKALKACGASCEIVVWACTR